MMCESGRVWRDVGGDLVRGSSCDESRFVCTGSAKSYLSFICPRLQPRSRALGLEASPFLPNARKDFHSTSPLPFPVPFQIRLSVHRVCPHRAGQMHEDRYARIQLSAWLNSMLELSLALGRMPCMNGGLRVCLCCISSSGSGLQANHAPPLGGPLSRSELRIYLLYVFLDGPLHLGTFQVLILPTLCTVLCRKARRLSCDYTSPCSYNDAGGRKIVDCQLNRLWYLSAALAVSQSLTTTLPFRYCGRPTSTFTAEALMDPSWSMVDTILPVS
jgi:hypothetical protein